MATTVLDALQNGIVNLETIQRMVPQIAAHPIFMIAFDQIQNAARALENGKGANDVIQEHMFGEVTT